MFLYPSRATWLVNAFGAVEASSGWSKSAAVPCLWAAEEDAADDGLGQKVAALLSQAYAKFQNKAGETVGIKPGAAWRAAMEAASENGGRQARLTPRDCSPSSAAIGATTRSS